MHSAVTINGLPRKLRQDAWWFSADVEVDYPETPKASFGGSVRNLKSIWVSIILFVAAADWLFWGWDVGISLAFFVGGLCAVSFAIQTGKRSVRDGKIAVAFTTLAILPIIEQVHLLSVLMMLGIVSAYAVWLGSDRVYDWVQQVKAMLKFLVLGPVLALADAWDGVERVQKKSSVRTAILREITSWMLPLSLGFMFLVLLSAANPFMDEWIGNLFKMEAPDLSFFKRILFWIAIVCLVWPFLNVLIFAARLPHAAKTSELREPSPIVNEKSVRNSLVLFNILFAIQIVSDGLYLWGGAALPDGMSYASYAHRGAYPLIATALLAGGFAILTQRFQQERTVRWLVFTWIGQNLMLTYAAIFRLQLYVDAYALTYLRLAAFIWMGLVFLGLALIIAQMIRRHPVRWLVKWNGVALMSVLYIACFVNFTAVIANHNVNHPASERALDHWYICQMGPHALPAILGYEAQSGEIFCPRNMPAFMGAENWRDWGFRDWRLGRYLSRETIYD